MDGGGAPGPARRWAPLAVATGIAAVVAAVVVPLSLRNDAGPDGRSGQPGDRGPGDPSGGAVPTMPPDQGAGVPVEGTGTLLRDGAGPVRLCAEVTITMDLPTSGAGCGRVAVNTTGVDPAVLVHKTTGGQAYSDPVHVEGTYRDGTLAATRVSTYRPEPPPVTEPSIPCASPAGGWPPGDGLPAPDDGSAFNALVTFIRAHPNRYTEIWEGHPDGPPSAEMSYAPTRKVYVVGTTGDVGAARAELSAIFPGNLCVHRVTHTAEELERIAAQLRAVDGTEAWSDVVAGKVRVKVVALDPPTMAILDRFGRDALLIEEPLLQWLD